MAGDDLIFPAANAAEEYDLGKPNEFPVDPISSDLATSKEPDKVTQVQPHPAFGSLSSSPDSMTPLISN